MSKNNENPGGEITFLLPDISGFTKFLKETEISHSRHIIEELIAIIIRETKPRFRIVEVEGDALFLYQLAEKIDAETVFKVASDTYIAFHKHLINYERLRICNCGACTAAVKLSLKFIVHSGAVEFAKVNGKNKPYGLETIKAHRLMKNNIDGRDYILFSKSFTDNHAIDHLPANFYRGQQEYDEIGTIHYSYINLRHLKESLKPDDYSHYQSNNTLKVIASETMEIDAPIEIVYKVLSDFKYRPLWNKEAKIVDHNEKDIYRIGSEHYCIINNKKFRIKTIGSKNSKLEFGEQIYNNGPFREINLYFIFNKATKNTTHTQLTVEIRGSYYKLLKPVIDLIVKPKLRKKVPEMIAIIKRISEDIYQERNINSVAGVTK
ncbi:MAG: DUF2652 domain-containing protein [Cyclobacteriaceae bacterium]